MERKAFKLLHDAESSWWYRARANVIERVLSRHATSAHETILDLGAGFGGMHDSLERYGVVDAFEPDKEAQTAARERGYRIVHETMDASKLPHDAYSFIAIFDVLEHTGDDSAFLVSLHKMLNKDGALIITVPAFPFLWSEHDVTHHHYRRYTKKSLRAVLQKNGFTLSYVSYWNFLLFFPAALVRLLGSSGESSLSMPRFLNTAIKHMVIFESQLIPNFSLPFGTGIVAYAKKTSNESAAKKESNLAKNLLIAPLKVILSALPGDAPMFIYTTLLRPRPLRASANYILRRIIPKELELPEGTLLLNQNDPVVSGALALGAYEAFFSDAFRKRLSEQMTIVDIGANLGYYTLIGSKRVNHVIAFEPEHDNATLLEATLVRNERSNVTLIKKGLGDQEESRPLALHPDNKGKHTLLGIDEQGVMSVDIPVTTLDRALEEIDSPKVDLIKIDIEGWEAKALRGAKETIRVHHPIIMFEFAPHRISAAGDDPLLMLHELEDDGYTLFVIDEDHDTLMPLDPTKLLHALSRNDSYVNILAEPNNLS